MTLKRLRAGSGKNISPRLQTTGSKVSSENRESLGVLDENGSIARFAEALGTTEHRSGGVVQKSPFARLASFDFRLFRRHQPI
jgi:hypothetical protein